MLTLNVNGQEVSVDAPDDACLLSVLTDDLHLAGQKYGCGLSQCGACTVLMDGEAVKSCQTKAQAAVGRSVTTLEGLRENGAPGRLQQAFIDEQGAQIGYCGSGIIMAAQAPLDRNPAPTESDVRAALNANLYRCGTHNRAAAQWDVVSDLPGHDGTGRGIAIARYKNYAAMTAGAFKHMRKTLKRLRGYTGRVMRDLRRHLEDIPEGDLRDRIIARLVLVSHLLHQQPKGADKIYALHEPEVDCISKGKARVRYEFGCKVSVTTTLDEGIVVGMRSFVGNPYDGHTLKEALEQVKILTDQRPDLVVVDRGYRGRGVEATRVLISGTKRGLTPKLVADLRRHSAIEAEIGHVKTDGRLTRYPLKGTVGDALFATLCACGHNIRKILAHLRVWSAWIIAVLWTSEIQPNRRYLTADEA